MLSHLSHQTHVSKDATSNSGLSHCTSISSQGKVPLASIPQTNLMEEIPQGGFSLPGWSLTTKMSCLKPLCTISTPSGDPFHALALLSLILTLNEDTLQISETFSYVCRTLLLFSNIPFLPPQGPLS